MATCKDCIHHDLCFDNGTLFVHYGAKGINIEDVENKCPFKAFKNKADFVEVTRCSKCEYKEDCEQYIYIDCCRNDLVFCSCGVPKNDKE